MNSAVVAVPSGLTLALSVAVVAATAVGVPVVTVGAVGAVGAVNVKDVGLRLS